MSEQKKKLVAYHEAGHAILGALMSLELGMLGRGHTTIPNEEQCDHRRT